MQFLNLILASIIFFLPAYIANAMPVIASGLNLFKVLAKPINKKVFGESKTYRGFFVGIIGALMVGLIQFAFGLYNFSTWENNLMFTLLLSFYLGFGALFGDLIKSYFKRRIGIKSGKPWIIFDQIDYVIGGLIVGSLIVVPSLELTIILLVISPLFALLSNVIAYKLKIKKVWW
jgi:CDP-2,3-bis-(O-geranylgeranyl)-sn-glycerol synthase